MEINKVILVILLPSEAVMKNLFTGRRAVFFIILLSLNR